MRFEIEIQFRFEPVRVIYSSLVPKLVGYIYEQMRQKHILEFLQIT